MKNLTAADFREFQPIITEARCIKVINGRTLVLGVVMPEPYGPTKFTARLVNVQVGEPHTIDVKEKYIGRLARSVIQTLVLNKIVQVRVCGMNKYGYPMVRVYSPDNIDLSQHLLDERLALPEGVTNDFHQLYDAFKARTSSPSSEP